MSQEKVYEKGIKNKRSLRGMEIHIKSLDMNICMRSIKYVILNWETK